MADKLMEWIGGLHDALVTVGDKIGFNVVPVDENGPLLTGDNPGSVVLRGNDGSIQGGTDNPLKADIGALDKDIDDITAYVKVPSAISDGNKTVTTAGTAVTLVASSTACEYVTITALLGNTGLISVGGSTTTPSGTVRGDVLAAGDSTVVLIDDLQKVYINSTVNSEGVSYRYG